MTSKRWKTEHCTLVCATPIFITDRAVQCNTGEKYVRCTATRKCVVCCVLTDSTHLTTLLLKWSSFFYCSSSHHCHRKGVVFNKDNSTHLQCLLYSTVQYTSPNLCFLSVQSLFLTSQLDRFSSQLCEIVTLSGVIYSTSWISIYGDESRTG